MYKISHISIITLIYRYILFYYINIVSCYDYIWILLCSMKILYRMQL